MGVVDPVGSRLSGNVLVEKLGLKRSWWYLKSLSCKALGFDIADEEPKGEGWRWGLESEIEGGGGGG